MRGYIARFSVESCCCGMRGETLIIILAKNKKDAKKLAKSKEEKTMGIGRFRLKRLLDLYKR